ncbi:MAG: integration host factor, beta subunit [Magnetococcales bacterium]|nr:integration host factor, beta subunit [Magnetococcales bacterium]HIJ84440.1 integration host factor subunit beta [Magnetococcales bacterium]
MTKSDLVRVIAEQNRLPTPHVADIIDAALEAVIKSLEEGQSVRLRGFGQFVLKLRPPRKGRSLATGTAMVIPAKRVAVFKPGMEMQRRLEGHLIPDEQPKSEGGEKLVAPKADSGKRLKEAFINLREIRDNTTFLWRNIQGLKGGGHSLTCQIRRSTFFQVEENLAWLQGQNFFKFSVNQGADIRDDGILQLRLYDISEQFNQLVSQMVYNSD